MKTSKSNRNQKIAFDGITFGQASHHIGKRMTTKIHKNKNKYNRKGKSKFTF
jgi:hypothetical protein